jgi:hypothetical protein
MCGAMEKERLSNTVIWIEIILEVAGRIMEDWS